MTKVIFVNGPPRSGKDTVGEIIKTLVPAALTTKMAYSLKVGSHALIRAMLGRLTPSSLSLALNDAVYEDVKDNPIPELGGKTWREIYIAVSENLIKPLYGEEYWGELVAKRIAGRSGVPLWVITDSGFEPETRPIIELVGKENCALIKIRRPGCDFSNDSRSYIDIPGIEHTILINNGTMLDLEMQTRALIEELKTY